MKMCLKRLKQIFRCGLVHAQIRFSLLSLVTFVSFLALLSCFECTGELVFLIKPGLFSIVDTNVEESFVSVSPRLNNA